MIFESTSKIIFLSSVSLLLTIFSLYIENPVSGLSEDVPFVWKTEFIDIAGSNDEFSFCLDGNDIPHLVYEINGELVYTNKQDGLWITEAIPLERDETRFWDYRCWDFDVDGNQNIHLILGDDIRNSSYGIRNENGWYFQDLGDINFHFPDIKVTHDGTAHIVFRPYLEKKGSGASYDNRFWPLGYMKISNGSIQKKIFEWMYDISFPSLDVDEAGNPHIVCSDRENHTSYYITSDGERWNVEVLDLGFDQFQVMDIVIDNFDRPNILFPIHNLTGDFAVIAYKYGEKWLHSSINDVFYFGNHPFGIDIKGNPYLITGSNTLWFREDEFWESDPLNIDGLRLQKDVLHFNSRNEPLFVGLIRGGANSFFVLYTGKEADDQLLAAAFVDREPSIGEEFILTGEALNAKNPIEKYQWRSLTSQNQIWGSGETLTISVKGPRVHTLVLRVEDTQGNFDEGYVNVFVIDRESPIADAGEDVVGETTVVPSSSERYSDGGLKMIILSTSAFIVFLVLTILIMVGGKEKNKS